MSLSPIITSATQPEKIKTILLATDFSDHAGAALDWAIELAKAHKAHLEIVHAVETDLPALVDSQRIQQAISDAHQKAARWQVSASASHHVGKPWVVVPAAAAKINADLIVLGARGKTNLAGRLLGSTADRIIKTTSIPVMVVRDEMTRPTAITSVLVASDFSEESALAIRMAIRLVHPAEQEVRLVLLHVIALHLSFPDPSAPVALQGVPVPEYWDRMEQHAKTTLGQIARQIQTKGLLVQTKSVRGSPGQEILREAQSMGAQLIAIGTQGRTGLNRFFLGSVAEWVLHQAQCPVLTVRKPDSADSPLAA